MRTAYHEQLDALIHQLAEMCRLAGIAMERATQSLLQADLVLAEQVIGDHEQISAASARAEEAAFVLLALQAPHPRRHVLLRHVAFQLGELPVKLLLQVIQRSGHALAQHVLRVCSSKYRAAQGRG